LLDLVERVLEDPHSRKRRGIDQGNPYSPTALNVVLHHHLDAPIQRNAEYPLLSRYADDLTIAADSVAECQKVLEKAGQLVKPLGLTLVNEQGSPVDLDRDGPVKVMGLELSKSNGKLVYGMGDRAWQNLEKQLLGAHQDGKPERMARRVLSGWIQANGLALENVTEQEKRISWLLGSLGFHEVSTKEVRGWIESAHRQWRDILGD